MRPCERRERLVNIALTLPRSRACSAARRTASRCTSSKAAATWPISSRECTPTDSTDVSTSCGSDSESCLTSSGSRSWATRVAVSWRRRSERIMDRATTNAPTSETPRTIRIRAPLRIASRCDWSRSSRAFCSISPSRVCSIVFIWLILLESWSYQSRYERLVSVARPPLRTRWEYALAAVISELPLSSGAISSSGLPWLLS